MFCPKCGKKTLKGGLCRKCFMVTNPVRVNDMSIQVCRCNKYLHHGKWNNGLQDSIKEIVTENLILPPGAKIVDLKAISKFKVNGILLKIHLKYMYRDEEFEERINTKIKTGIGTCPQCSKISGGYYEAVIQLRGDIGPEVVVNPEVTCKVERVRGGFDIYVISSSHARRISRNMIKKGLLVKESAKLIGRRAGKNIYRIYISVKSPGFRVGDFLEYHNKKLQVLEIGKSILCRDITTRKRHVVALQKLQRAKLINTERDIRKAMVSSVNPQGIQILDLKDYKTFELPGKFEGMRERDEIEYLRIGGRVYLL